MDQLILNRLYGSIWEYDLSKLVPEKFLNTQLTPTSALTNKKDLKKQGNMSSSKNDTKSWLPGESDQWQMTPAIQHGLLFYEMNMVCRWQAVFPSKIFSYSLVCLETGLKSWSSLTTVDEEPLQLTIHLGWKNLFYRVGGCIGYSNRVNLLLRHTPPPRHISPSIGE
jgi:hypothetical protein